MTDKVRPQWVLIHWMSPESWTFVSDWRYGSSKPDDKIFRFKTRKDAYQHAGLTGMTWLWAVREDRAEAWLVARELGRRMRG